MLFVVERQHPLTIKCTVYVKKSIRSSFMLKLVLIFLREREAIRVRNEAEFLVFFFFMVFANCNASYNWLQAIILWLLLFF